MMTTAAHIERSRNWLTHDVFPLWSRVGVDDAGGFVEGLSFSGEPLLLPRRATVQARQIYSFRVGMDLGCCPQEEAKKIIERATTYLVEKYSLPSGAFVYSVDFDGEHHGANPDLYAQAFALFGLANAYAVSPRPEYRERALLLLKYLDSERKAKGSGYTELGKDGFLYQANPHMHLFEAALSWISVDKDPRWKKMAEQLLELCVNKFVDRETGFLCEHFDENWRPLRTDGNFIWEPGHHYEWAWLLAMSEKHLGGNLQALSRQLFDKAEKYGLCKHGFAVDEAWSNGEQKKRSSRFWPQCERIKAAVRLGEAKVADEALDALFKYLDIPARGLWQDAILESGEFSEQAPKASSLYHIINAMVEYISVRPQLDR